MRIHLLSLAIVLLTHGFVKAQDFDPLGQKKQEIQLRAQKFKAELNANFIDAARLERSYPERARELLRKNRAMLEDDAVTLTERERKEYMDDINLKLYRMNDRALSEKKKGEIDELRKSEIAAFNKKVKAHEARAIAMGNPPQSTTIAGYQKAYVDSQLAAVEAQKRYIQQLRDQQNSGSTYYKTPPASTVNAKDVDLMKALNSTLKVDFKGEPVKNVLEYLEEKSKGSLLFIVDEQGLKEAMIEPQLFLNDPVTKQFRQPIKVRTLLHMMLGERGMGYYLEDGQIIITKDAKALSKMVVKTYPVSNLVGGQQLVTAAITELQYSKPGPMGAPPAMGPMGNLLSQNIDGLTATIVGAVEPDYWKIANPNGPGTMTFVPNTASLQIRASLEVQYLLMASGLLENVKK